MTEPLVFHPNSTEFFEDPFAIYGRLRDEAPVYFNDRAGFYALSRYHDVYLASTNWQVFSSTHGSTLSDLVRSDFEPGGRIVNLDPPQHDRLRALVNRAFSPAGVARMEHIVRDVIERTLAPLAGRNSFDAVTEFAGIFPNEIISEVLGIPPDARPLVRRWTEQIFNRAEGSAGRGKESLDAYSAQHAFILELVREKRRNRCDDMISHLIEAEIADSQGGTTRLTDDEVSDFSLILGIAGTETVTKLVANAIVLFHRHRDQLKMVQQDPALLPAALDEVLRYWAPSHLQGRYTTTDVSLHGVTIPKSSPVFLITGAANRDPRAYDDPDVFDITRTNLPTSLGFGRGVHYCIGAALARAESRIAIGEFIKRWPRFDVDEAGLRRVHMANVAGFGHVPVSVAP